MEDIGLTPALLDTGLWATQQMEAPVFHLLNRNDSKSIPSSIMSNSNSIRHIYTPPNLTLVQYLTYNIEC